MLKKKNSLKKGKVSTNVINIIIVACIFVGLLVYMFLVDDIETIKNVIKNLNYTWLGVGFLCMIGYWLLEALCLHIVTKKTYKDQKFLPSLRVSMIGQLFNSITPFSSGRSTYASSSNGKRRKETFKYCEYFTYKIHCVSSDFSNIYLDFNNMQIYIF